jgi:predicted branched-subunit amino acid permease
MPTMSTSTTQQLAREKSAFWDAVRTATQTVPGLMAWGAVTGMAMIQSGLTVWQALAMTLLVYAGSAQIAALPLIVAGAPIGMIFLTAMMVNLRFVIFSAVIGPHFAYLPWYKRLWYGYFNADVVMALFPQRFPSQATGNAAGKLAYYKGLIVPNWMGWQIGTVAGILLASQIPPSWGIGFVGALVLLSIMIPLVVNRAALCGVLVAGGTAVMTISLPYRLGLLLAIVMGIAAAMAIDRLTARSQAGQPS